MSSKEPDYIYVMTNPSYPENEVKIGYTSDVETRRKALHATGVSRPFEVKFKMRVHNAYHLEQAVHQRLKNYRINDGREFFSCGVEMAVSTIKDLMNDYGVAPAKSFDASLANAKEFDENAYEAGQEAFHAYYVTHGTYFYDNSMITFEARVANCAKGRSFSDFARGWRQAAVDQKEIDVWRTKTQAREDAAKVEELQKQEKITKAAYDEGVKAASKGSAWKTHTPPAYMTANEKTAFTSGEKEYKSDLVTKGIIGAVGLIFMFASLVTGSKELFLLFVVIGISSFFVCKKFD